MSNPLRIALIGCGAITQQFHIPAVLAAAPKLNITVDTLLDPNPERLKEVSQIFPEAKQLQSLDQAEESSIDLGIVTSPTQFHAGNTIQLLNLGAHVLCEKPMSSSFADAIQMKETADARKRLLAIGLIRRFFPAVKSIHSIIQEKSLGSVIRFDFQEGHKFAWPATSDSFFRRESSGGGVLMDVGVHILDIMLHWFGEPIGFSCQDDSMGGVEGNAHLHLSFESNIEGSIRLSWDTPLRNKYIIECEKGYIIWEPGNVNAFTIRYNGSASALKNSALNDYSKNKEEHLYCPGITTIGQCFTEQIVNVVESIRAQDALRLPAEEGVKSIQLIEDCYKKSTLIPQEWLSIDELSALSKKRTPIEYAR